MIAYYPLFTGKNFLPFDYYHNWSKFIQKSLSKDSPPDVLFIQETKMLKGCRETDYAGLSILYPMQKFFSDSLRKGVIPLWDPYIGCGVPTFGGGQFRPFNPFQIPFYFHPSTNIYSFSIFLEIIAGFIFMYFFLLRNGLTILASIFGSLIFVMNPYVMNRLSFLDHLAAYFFLPLLLMAVDYLNQKGVKAIFIASIPFVLMGHIGHPELCFINTIIASLYFLFVLPGGLKGKSIKLILLGVVIVFSLSIYIFPLVKEHFLSFSYKKARIGGWEADKWSYIFTPTADIFLLPAIVFFVIISIFYFKEKKQRFFSLLAFVSLLYINGVIPAKITFIMIPPFYFKFLFWISIAILASFGLDKFLTLKINAGCIYFSFVWFILTIIVVKILPFSLIDYFPTLFLLFGISFVPLLFIAIVQIFPKLKKIFHFNAIIVFLICLPFSYPLSKALIPWNNYEFESFDIIENIKKDYKNERISSLVSPPYTVLPANAGSIFGVRTFELNSFLFPNTFFQQFAIDTYSTPTFLYFSNYRPEHLKRTGAKFVCVSKEASLPLKKKIKGHFAFLYEIPDCKGRLFFASKIFETSSQSLKQNWLKILKLDDSQVLVEGRHPYFDKIDAPMKNKLKFVEDSYHKVIVKAFCSEDSFLVLRDTYKNDWKAFVDDKETMSYRVDGCFRGIMLKKGEHLVKWVYRPIVLYISACITIIFHILIALLLLKECLNKNFAISINE